MPRPPSTFRRNLLLLAAAAILARLAIGAVSWQRVSNLSEVSRQVAHSQEVIGALESIRSGLQRAEVDQRTYLLTSEPSDLESFKVDLRKSRQDVDRVWNLTADNPDQQRRIVALIKIVDRRFELAETTAKLRQTSGLDAARKLVLSGQGAADLSAALSAIDELRSEENRLLDLRTRSEREGTSRALTGIAALSFGSILVIVGVAYWILQEFEGPRDFR